MPAYKSMKFLKFDLNGFNREAKIHFMLTKAGLFVEFYICDGHMRAVSQLQDIARVVK